MFKQQCLAVLLISILFIAPLANLNDTEETGQLIDTTISESGTLNGWPDVPTWRIGDKYTYETQFDVQQLIQQANVAASLNTLTGDTVPTKLRTSSSLMSTTYKHWLTKWKLKVISAQEIVEQPWKE